MKVSLCPLWMMYLSFAHPRLLLVYTPVNLSSSSRYIITTKGLFGRSFTNSSIHLILRHHLLLFRPSVSPSFRPSVSQSEEEIDVTISNHLQTRCSDEQPPPRCCALLGAEPAEQVEHSSDRQRVRRNSGSSRLQWLLLTAFRRSGDS